MDSVPQQTLSRLADSRFVAGMSGNPSIDASEDAKADLGRRLPGLESLFETMAGVRWAYMVLARPLADQMSAILGQTVIVENRPGAGGNVGMLDGHAEWRKLNYPMLPRTDSSSTPIFWW